MAEDKKIGLTGIAKEAVKGIGKAVGDALDRLVPQGRDELANAIFNGSAFRPGTRPGSATEAQQPAQPGGMESGQAIEPLHSGKDHPDDLPGATITPPEPPRDPPSGGAQLSYREQLNLTAARGGQDHDRGRGMSR